MPELPEVETIRGDLAPRLRGRTIIDARLFPGANGEVWNFVWRPRPASWPRSLRGARIQTLDRWGKYLIVRLLSRYEPAGVVVIHLGMTGQLTVRPAGDARPAHLRMALTLDRGTRLQLVDPRRFGRVGFWPANSDPEPFAGLSGVEPLDPGWTQGYLAKQLQRHPRSPVKALLLDQRVVAGFGNIYVDEALWQARLHPDQRSGTLTPGEIERLVRAGRSVIARGIANRGTSLNDYVDGQGQKGRNQEDLRVYGRAGQACRRCHVTLQSTRVAGRGTTHCPRCQPGTASPTKNAIAERRDRAA